jgi:hypothetical protein
MQVTKFKVVRRSRSLVFDLFLCGALMLLVQLPARASQSVALAWNPSVATNVAGYKIYSGTGSHNYSTTNVVGTATNATLTGLVEGKTYYFAATTYDSSGDESGFSTELSYTVPVTPATLAPAARSGGQFSFNVTGGAGDQYVVQASTNLVNWVNLQTNTVPFTFVDTNSASYSKRFYRTYYLSPN